MDLGEFGNCFAWNRREGESEYKEMSNFGIANHYATQCREESNCTVEKRLAGSASANDSVQLSGCCDLDDASVIDSIRYSRLNGPVCGFSGHGLADSWRGVFLCMFPCLLGA